MGIKLCGVAHRASMGPGGLGQPVTRRPAPCMVFAARGIDVFPAPPNATVQIFIHSLSPAQAVNDLKEGVWVAKEGNHVAPRGRRPMSGECLELDLLLKQEEPAPGHFPLSCISGQTPRVHPGPQRGQPCLLSANRFLTLWPDIGSLSHRPWRLFPV